MIASLIVLAGLANEPGAAQVGVGVRYGQGDGSAAYGIGEINARVHAVGRLHLTGAFESMGGTWGCVENSEDALTCGYDGRTLSVGPALALAETDRIYVAPRATVGWFERTGRYGGEEYRGSDHVTLALGIDGEVTLVGPVGLQLGLLHRRIVDGEYRDVAGEQPHFTAFLLGLGVVLR